MTPQLPPIVDRWPAAVRDRFEERAAIMQFDGCMPRDRAERLSEELTRSQWARAVEAARQTHLPANLLP